MTKLAFVDTETTGLNPYRNEVYEVAVILEDDGQEVDRLHLWLAVEVALADPDALRISHYYERRPDLARYGGEGVDLITGVGLRLEDAADRICVATAGAHLVGAVPNFDANFLTEFCLKQNRMPAWHYHLVDVEALMAGKLGLQPPWKSRDLAAALGVEQDEAVVHTAMGDTEWARQAYYSVFAP